jgi:hypothetical protein
MQCQILQSHVNIEWPAIIISNAIGYVADDWSSIPDRDIWSFFPLRHSSIAPNIGYPSVNMAGMRLIINLSVVSRFERAQYAFLALCRGIVSIFASVM